jgi:hypothetical protein
MKWWVPAKTEPEDRVEETERSLQRELTSQERRWLTLADKMLFKQNWHSSHSQ